MLASGWGPWAREGALLSYGPDLDDITRRSAAHVDKILAALARPTFRSSSRPGSNSCLTPRALGRSA